MSTHEETAFSSMVIRVFIPASDIVLMESCARELDITILSMAKFKEGMYVVEFYLVSSFSLYALGKLVSYYELIK